MFGLRRSYWGKGGGGCATGGISSGRDKVDVKGVDGSRGASVRLPIEVS